MSFLYTKNGSIFKRVLSMVLAVIMVLTASPLANTKTVGVDYDDNTEKTYELDILEIEKDEVKKITEDKGISDERMKEIRKIGLSEIEPDSSKDEVYVLITLDKDKIDSEKGYEIKTKDLMKYAGLFSVSLRYELVHKPFGYKYEFDGLDKIIVKEDTESMIQDGFIVLPSDEELNQDYIYVIVRLMNGDKEAFKTQGHSVLDFLKENKLEQEKVERFLKDETKNFGQKLFSWLTFGLFDQKPAEEESVAEVSEVAEESSEVVGTEDSEISTAESENSEASDVSEASESAESTEPANEEPSEVEPGEESSEVVEEPAENGEEPRIISEEEMIEEPDIELDFSSKRLIVATSNEAIFRDSDPIIGSFDNMYLLQYGSVGEAKIAYVRFLRTAEFVEPDQEFEIADDEMIDEGEGKSVPEASELVDSGENNGEGEEPAETPGAPEPGMMAEGETPFDGLDKVEELKERRYDIAIIDTGYVDGDENVELVSMVGDDGIDVNGHGTEIVRYVRTQVEDAKILSIKAIDDTGVGSASAVYAAIEYAIKQNVKVINLSISSRKAIDSAIITEAVKEAVNKGIYVVGAAGNNGNNAKYYIPGSIDEAIIVGVCNEHGYYLPISNYGETVDYNAVEETTSFAAASVSGLILRNGIESLSSYYGYVFSTDENDLSYYGDEIWEEMMRLKEYETEMPLESSFGVAGSYGTAVTNNNGVKVYDSSSFFSDVVSRHTWLNRMQITWGFYFTDLMGEGRNGASRLFIDEGIPEVFTVDGEIAYCFDRNTPATGIYSTSASLSNAGISVKNEGLVLEASSVAKLLTENNFKLLRDNAEQIVRAAAASSVTPPVSRAEIVNTLKNEPDFCRALVQYWVWNTVNYGTFGKLSPYARGSSASDPYYVESTTSGAWTDPKDGTPYPPTKLPAVWGLGVWIDFEKFASIAAAAKSSASWTREWTQTITPGESITLVGQEATDVWDIYQANGYYGNRSQLTVTRSGNSTIITASASAEPNEYPWQSTSSMATNTIYSGKPYAAGSRGQFIVKTSAVATIRSKIIIENPYNKGYIEVKKVDAVFGGNLSGATFVVEKKNGNSWTYVETMTEKANSKGTYVSSLLKGDINNQDAVFRVRETVAPPNYESTNLFSQEFQFLDQDEKTLYATAQNTPTPYTFYVTKKDRDTLEDISGATFVIKQFSKLANDYVDTGMVTMTYDAANKHYVGEVTATKDNNGRFQIIETEAPPQYKTDFVKNVTITSATAHELVFDATNVLQHKEARIELTKTDPLGNAIEGAVFYVYQWNESAGQYDISPYDTLVFSSGKYVSSRSIFRYDRAADPFYNLGKFKVVEYKAPEGYINRGFEKEFEITDDGDYNTVEVIDDTILDGPVINPTNSITIDKTAPDETTPIAGVTFKITNLDTGETRTATTDAEGHILQTKLSKGQYTLQETDCPATYKLDDTVYTFEVDENGQIDGADSWSISIVNIPKRKVAFVKEDDDLDSTTLSATALANSVSKTFPAGIEFTIYAWDKDLGDYLSNPYIIVTFNGLSFTDSLTLDDPILYWTEQNEGKFKVVETTYGDGYVVPATPDVKYISIPVDNTVAAETVEFTNVPNKVKIKKQNKAGQNLEGVAFKLWKAGDEAHAIAYLSDANGNISIERIPEGLWYLQETATLVGYAKDDTIFRFSVDQNGYITYGDSDTPVTEAEATFINYPTTIVKLIKRDSLTNVKSHEASGFPKGTKFYVYEWSEELGDYKPEPVRTIIYRDETASAAPTITPSSVNDGTLMASGGFVGGNTMAKIQPKVMFDVEDVLTNNDSTAEESTFPSKTLFVYTTKPSEIPSYATVLTSVGNAYLIRFDTYAEAEEYYNHSHQMSGYVTIDESIVKADGEDADGSIADTYDEDNNPLMEFATTSRVAGSYDVALIDTGSNDTGVTRVSMLGDDGKDRNGHGTQMTGYILQQNPSASILSIKALDDSGVGTVSSVYAAIKYAISMNVKVINLSMAAYSSTGMPIIREAIKEAISKGIVVVGAAGNDNADVRNYIPGGIDEVIVAGSADSEGIDTGSTNWGSTVDVLARASSTSEASAKLAGYLSANLDLAYVSNQTLIMSNETLLSRPTKASGDGSVVREDNVFEVAAVTITRTGYYAKYNETGTGTLFDNEWYVSTKDADANNGNRYGVRNTITISNISSGKKLSSFTVHVYLDSANASGRNTITYYAYLTADSSTGNGAPANDKILGTTSQTVTTTGTWQGAYYDLTFTNLNITSNGTYYVWFYTNSGKQASVDVRATYKDATEVSANYTITVNYNGNGSSNTTFSASSTGATNLPAAPSRTGYSFAGWYDAATNGTKLGDASKGYSFTKDMTIYAHWTAKDAKVTVKAGTGGSASLTSGGTKYDDSIEITATPSTGYKFDKWTFRRTSDNADAGSSTNNPWTTTNVYLDGLTATANFTAKTYTVTYDKNTGSGTVPNNGTATYNANFNASSPSSLTKTGYTFKEWNTKSDGTGTSFVPGTGKNWTIDANTTLCAIWTLNRYSLYLDPNGGSATFKNANNETTEAHTTTTLYDPAHVGGLAYGTGAYNAIVGSSSVTRTGYSFSGWYTAVSGGKQVWDAYGHNVSDGTYWSAAYGAGGTWKYDGGLTVHAHWTPNTTTVTFDPNGGTYNGTSTVTMTYDATTNNAPGSATRPGYTFQGWYTAKTGGTQVYNEAGQNVNDGTYWNGAFNSGTWKSTASSVTFYAQWQSIPKYIQVNNVNSVSSFVPGGIYGLYASDGITLLAQYNTGAAFESTALAAGTYWLKEIKNATGYEPNETPTKVVIPDTQEGTQSITITHKAEKNTEFVDEATESYTMLIETPDNKGKWKLVEVESTPGYIMDGTEREFSTDDADAENVITIDGLLNPPNEYKIKKVNAANTNQVIAGAVFELRTTSGTVVQTATTGTDGYAVFRRIAPGTYNVVETSVPSPYKVSTSPISLTVDEHGYISGQDSTEITVKNTTEDYPDFVITKYLEGSPLEGLQFEIYNSSNVLAYTTAATDSTGSVTIPGNALAAGNYTIREKYNASFFSSRGIVYQSGTLATIVSTGTKITKQGTTESEVKLNNSKNQLTLYKTGKDGATVTPLGGVEFWFWQGSATIPASPTYSAVTKDNGYIDTIKGLAYGTWYYAEVKGPDGYVWTNTVKSFNVTNTTTTVPLTVSNRENEICIRKSNGSGLIAGAEFAVWNTTTDFNKTAVTNASGYAVLKKVPDGTYYYQETKAPEGYIRDPKVYKFTVEKGLVTSAPESNPALKIGDNGYSSYFGIVNPQNQISIWKVDSQGNELRTDYGTITFQKKYTSPTGTVSTSTITLAHLGSTFGSYVIDGGNIHYGYYFEFGLPDGSYEYKELTTKAGYEVTDQTFSFTVKDGVITNTTPSSNDLITVDTADSTDAKFIVTNRKWTDIEVKVTKTDRDNSSSRLTGAVFTAYGWTGTQWVEAGTLTMTEPGVYKMTRLPVEDYVQSNGKVRFKIVETQAPEGYVADWSQVIEAEAIEQTLIKEYTVDNSKNKLRIEKYAKGTNTPLEGIEFEIKINGTPYLVSGANPTTGRIGEIELTGLPRSSTITIQEVGDYDNYEIDPTVYQFEVKADGKIVRKTPMVGENAGTFTEVEGSELILRVEDEQIQEREGHVRIHKTNTSGDYLYGARFTVYEWDERKEGGAGYKDTALMTLVPGVDDDDKPVYMNPTSLKYSSLNKGKFKVVETMAPQGYKNEFVAEFTIEKRGDLVQYFLYDAVDNENKLTVKKTGTDGKNLDGIEFEFNTTNTDRTLQNQYHKNHTTDGNGEFTIQNLVEGTYTLKEVSRKDGYVLNETVFTIRVDAESNIYLDGDYAGRTQEYTLNVVNKANELTIKKYNKDETEMINGARFTIKWTSEDGSETTMTTYTTAGGGIINVKALKDGKYEVEEIYVPTPYVLETPHPKRTFEVKDGMFQAYDTIGSTTNELSLSFANHETGDEDWLDIYIEKVSSADSNIKLTETEFTLYEWDNSILNPANRWKSEGTVIPYDATIGAYHIRVESKQINDGNFLIKETANQIGYAGAWEYKITSMYTDVNVHETSRNHYELDFRGDEAVTNDPIISILIKRDQDTEEFLDGAIFYVWEGSTEVAPVEHITGEEYPGLIYFENLKRNTTYYYQEQVAPRGYVIDPSMHWFHVDSNGYITGEYADDVPTHQFIINFTNPEKRTITVHKTINTDELTKVYDEAGNFLYFNTGDPTFIFELDGKDGLDREVHKVGSVTFTNEAMQTDGVWNGPYVTLSYTFDYLIRGEYTVTERKVLKYALDDIRNVVGGEIEGDAVVFDLVNNQDTEAEFKNKATTLDGGDTHKQTAINVIGPVEEEEDNSTEP